MPRTVDPSTIATGNGLASNQSVDKNALVQPTGEINPLTAHLNDPSRAHMASSTGIVDAGSYYTSDEVEGALQEIGGGTSGGFLNGLMVGGTFTDVGLVLTLDNPTAVLLNGMEQDYSGETVTLADNATQYVYIHGTTGVVTANLVTPALTAEHIFIAEVTTAAGVVTGSRDGRFFVPNVQRKPSFSLRTVGAAENQAAEGNFLSLEAALLWLELYTPGGSVETRKIVVRGVTTIAAAVVLPVGNIIFEGEGDGEFVTGAVLTPMFDLGGMDNITFRNLTFTAEHAGSTAIEDTTGPSDNLVVEGCSFLTGAQVWGIGINLVDVSDANLGHIVRDTNITADDQGLVIDRADQCLVSNVKVEGVASVGTGGIILSAAGAVASEGYCTIENSLVDGFDTGISVAGNHQVVRGCSLLNSRIGLDITDGDSISVVDTNIVLDNSDGPGVLGGIDGVLVSADRVQIKGCNITNPRALWTATVNPPRGILVAAGFEQTQITDCNIVRFYNTSTIGGVGILLTNTSTEAYVAGTRIDTTDVGVASTGTVTDTVLDGLRVENVRAGAVLSGARTRITNSTIILDATVGTIGVQQTGTNCVIEGNFIRNPRAAWAPGVVTFGVQVNSSNCSITNNSVYSFRNTADSTGFGIQGGGSWLIAKGNIVVACQIAISVSAGTNNMSIQDNTLDGDSASALGIDVLGTDVGGSRTYDVTLAGNVIRSCTSAGIRFQGYARDVLVQGNHIDMILPATPYDPTGVGIKGEHGGGTSNLRYVTVSGNTTLRCTDGISFRGVLASPHLDISIVNNTVHHCAYVQHLVAPPPDDYPGRGPKGIGLEHTSNASIQNNHISRIGIGINDSGVESYPGASDVQSKGIYLRNCLQPTILGNVIVDTTYRNTPAHYASANGIYIDYRGSGAAGSFDTEFLVASNNTVTWETGEGDYGVYVEAGGSARPHVVEKVTINNNTVHYPARSGICLVADRLAQFSQGTINSNVIADCSAAAVTTLQQGGIAVQTITGTGGDTVTFKDLVIDGNSIEKSDQEGIILYMDRPGSLSNIQVSNNKVIDTANSNIRFYITANVSSGNVQDIKVSDNSVSDATLPNIHVYTSGGAAAANIVGCVISDNQIINNNATQGLYVQNVTGSFTNLHVTNNTLKCGGVGLGLVISQTVASANEHITVNGNRVISSTNIGLTLAFAGAVSGLSCDENQIVETDASGITVTVPGNLTTGSVSGNVIQDYNTDGAVNYGLLLSLGADATALNVHDNTLQTTRADSIGLAITIAGVVVGVGITGNSIIQDEGTGFSFTSTNVITGPTLVSITGNNVQAAAATAVEGALTTNATLSVCVGNTSNGTGGGQDWTTQFAAAIFPVNANNSN